MSERPGRLVLEKLDTLRRLADLGRKLPVADAAIADVAVVLARSDAGLEACLVPLKQDGVSLEPVRTFDTSRGHSVVTFEGAETEALGDGPMVPDARPA